MRHLRSLAVLGLGLGGLVGLAAAPATSEAQAPAETPAAPPASPTPPAAPPAAATSPAATSPAATTPAAAAPAAKAPAAGLPAAGAAPAAPKKRGKATSVCPGKILPLQVGNEWTYEAVAAPTTPAEGMTRLTPLRPKAVVVTVLSAETPVKGGETTVKLREKSTYDLTRDPTVPKHFDQTVETTIVCSAKKFDISPGSFFFQGEPGGFRGLTLPKFERKKETSLKLTNGTIGELEWIEEIVAEYEVNPTQGSRAKMGKGKIEIERKFTPQQPENVATRYGTFLTEKLGITTTGRVHIDQKVAPDGKPCSTKKPSEDKQTEVDVPSETCELPAGWINFLWFADNVGLLQSLNHYTHMYQLVDVTLN